MIALKPPHTGGYDDFSEPLLPGSFIASAVANPLELADHFVHELQHNRLSFVEERGHCSHRISRPAATTRRGATPPARCSCVPRVYVFVAVYRYWRAVLDDPTEGVAEYARDRVTRLPVQLAVAVRMLRRYGSLTPLGAALLDELTVHVEAINADPLPTERATTSRPSSPRRRYVRAANRCFEYTIDCGRGAAPARVSASGRRPVRGSRRRSMAIRQRTGRFVIVFVTSPGTTTRSPGTSRRMARHSATGWRRSTTRT